MNNAALAHQPVTGSSTPGRRLPIGAELLANGGVSFRVWAPRRRSVDVILDGVLERALPLASEANGYFSGTWADQRAGTLYQFRLDGEEGLYPDPASRYQPRGVHGPSQVIDPSLFEWTDADWKGIGPRGQVLYEMHIGTFTPEGTWTAAQQRLPHLRELGITCLEVMPVNEFVGTFGWGYDGVDLFAPFHHYGKPDDFRQFVNQAHRLGIAVILDLVYNHLGPDGNFLPQFSTDYFSQEHHTDWGEALNFDGPQSAAVREFFITNAIHWITEYHLDGFRFDATQAIVDSSKEHILAAISRSVRAAAASRSLYLINENEPQHTRLVRPAERDGYGMDALWNDDFHHSAMAALSGHREAYYSDYLGTPQEFISTAKWGYLYQGQRYHWQSKRRGTPGLDLPHWAFVNFIQNHDQVANSGRGLRVHQITSPGELRAMTAAMLLMPQTPLLFQGQEFAASSPFYYFADHNPELAKLVKAGRARELSQFPSLATPSMQAILHDPADRRNFERCKLDWREMEGESHAPLLKLHQDLLKLRRTDSVFSDPGHIDGAVLGQTAFLLRYFSGQDPWSPDEAGAGDRLLIVNLGVDLELHHAPEPLLAPPIGRRWATLWSSEDPAYGGSGMPDVDTEEEGWLLPGRSAVVLRGLPASEASVRSRAQQRGSDQSARRRPPTN